MLRHLAHALQNFRGANISDNGQPLALQLHSEGYDPYTWHSPVAKRIHQNAYSCIVNVHIQGLRTNTSSWTVRCSSPTLQLGDLLLDLPCAATAVHGHLQCYGLDSSRRSSVLYHVGDEWDRQRQIYHKMTRVSKATFGSIWTANALDVPAKSVTGTIWSKWLLSKPFLSLRSSSSLKPPAEDRWNQRETLSKPLAAMRWISFPGWKPENANSLIRAITTRSTRVYI